MDKVTTYKVPKFWFWFDFILIMKVLAESLFPNLINIQHANPNS